MPKFESWDYHMTYIGVQITGGSDYRRSAIETDLQGMRKTSKSVILYSNGGHCSSGVGSTSRDGKG